MEKALDRALLYGGLFEYIQAARIEFSQEAITEFMPFVTLKASAYGDVQYRRLWALFTALLGTSRLVTYYYRDRGIYVFNFLLHLLEVGFFVREASKYPEPLDLKMKFLLAIIQGIPILKLLNFSTYTKKKGGEGVPAQSLTGTKEE